MSWSRVKSLLCAWRTTLGLMDALARIASFCIIVRLLAAMAQRAQASMLLLTTEPPRIETPRAEIRGDPWGGAQEMPLLLIAAHSHHGADVRGTRASGPEVSGTSLAEVPLLTSGQRQFQRWTCCSLHCWLQPRTCPFRLCRHALQRLWLFRTSASC